MLTRKQKKKKIIYYYEFFIIFAIFYTSWYFAAEAIYGDEIGKFRIVIEIIDKFILFTFTVEYIVRIFFTDNR